MLQLTKTASLVLVLLAAPHLGSASQSADRSGSSANRSGSSTDPEYRLGMQDVIALTVLGHAELSGKFTVLQDGTLLVPLVGSVSAAGHTVSQIQTEVAQRLADGFLKNPSVSVDVQQYASQRVFVMGEVRTPGAIPLNGVMTLLEALARAGSLTEQAGGEVVVLRNSTGSNTGGIALGQAGSADIARIDVEQLRRGVISANLPLQNGDTIFVPRSEKIFVLGLVNNPGTFTLEPGVTVLRAISLAGGTTPLGSTSRIRIVRIVDGVKMELKAKLDDHLKADDTVVVRARIF